MMSGRVRNMLILQAPCSSSRPAITGARRPPCRACVAPDVAQRRRRRRSPAILRMYPVASIAPTCYCSGPLPARRHQHRSQRSHGRSGPHRRGPAPCGAGVLEGFSGVSNLMAPETATIFSAIIAITSVSINLYGGLITEKRRAELAREVERERQLMAAADEERSVVARYRGPLLEATVDLEARLYHIATLTGEWASGEVVCEEEVVYTLFTLAQWLGFLEVIRREGPRERSFLQRRSAATAGAAAGAGAAGTAAGTAATATGGGSGSGSDSDGWWDAAGGAAGSGGGGDGGGGSAVGGPDTLTTLVEGFRFVLSAHPDTLRKWYEQGSEREHPGCRSRASFLRGTPALRYDSYSDGDAADGGMYGAASYSMDAWRQRPPPPSPSAAAQAALAGPGMRADRTRYGRAAVDASLPYAGAVQLPQPPSALSYSTPPPPTRPVMLSAMQGAGQRLEAGPGAGADSELVIGSLDENDLAAAGLGLPDALSHLAPPSARNGDRNGGGAATDAAAASRSTGSAAAAAALQHASSSPYAGGSAGGAGAGGLTTRVSGFDTLASSYLSSLASVDEAGGSLEGVGLGGVSVSGGGGVGRPGGRLAAPRDVFHVSRGAQRSIGSMMVVTPMGASRHYTLSYGEFYNRYYLDDFFAGWLRPVHTDILALVGGRRWAGQPPFPLNRWTRLLLLQQLLVEAIDLLDPAHVRVPANRRVVLAPLPFKPAPELEAYRARMAEMSQLDSPLLAPPGGQQGPHPLARLGSALRGLGEAIAAGPPPAVAAPAPQAQPPAALTPPPPPAQAPYGPGYNAGASGAGSVHLQQQQQQQLLYLRHAQPQQQQLLLQHGVSPGAGVPPAAAAVLGAPRRAAKAPPLLQPSLLQSAPPPPPSPGVAVGSVAAAPAGQAVGGVGAADGTGIVG